MSLANLQAQLLSKCCLISKENKGRIEALSHDTPFRYRIIAYFCILPGNLTNYSSGFLFARNLLMARGICANKSEANKPVSPISALTSSEAAVCR